MPPLAETLLVGLGLGFSLAAPPGPIMAKLAFEVARGRRATGFLVGVGATSADAMFFVLVAFGVLRVLPDRRLLGALGLAGVVLMNWFAYQAWRAATHPPAADERAATGWFGGFLLAVTSPFNWAWWLLSGVPFVSLYGPWLGAGFLAALLVVVAAAVALFAYGSARIARFEMYVAYVSAAMLAGFGLFLCYNSFRFLAGG